MVTLRVLFITDELPSVDDSQWKLSENWARRVIHLRPNLKGRIMPDNITLTPEQYEAARQRLITGVKSVREDVKEQLDQKRLELDLSRSAEVVYEQHKTRTPWSYGVGSRPEDIADHCERLRVELAECDAELALLESLSAPPARKLLLKKGTPMTKDKAGNWFQAGAGYTIYGWLQEDVYEDEWSYQHKVGPEKPPAEPVRVKSPVTDPVADFFTPIGKDTGKKLP